MMKRQWLLTALLIFSLFAAQTAAQQPDYRLLYLDWRGGAGSALGLSCQETWRQGCVNTGGSNFIYWVYAADDFAAAQAQAVKDFIPLSGYTKVDPQGNTYVCAPATVNTTGPQFVWWGPWVGTIYFTQQCTFTDRWGRGGPQVSEPYLSLGGDCEPGFQPPFNFMQTGECTRSQGPCLKYPQNNAFGCGKTVAQMQAVVKAPDDPTRLFHASQTCVARKACDLRCRMDNCKWMENLIPNFIYPYMTKAGEWPQREADCQALKQTLGSMPGGNWIAAKECVRSTGTYHVRADLQAAVNQYGCGSDADWEMVAQLFKGCLIETSPNDPAWAQAVGERFIKSVRAQVNKQCKAVRTVQGKPVDINNDIRGKACAQQ